MKQLFTLLVALCCCAGMHAKRTVYPFVVTDGNGNPVSMKQYKGKVLLIVNTATKCGFTPQYAELQSLYEELQGEGLEILDFPCNQFGNQAPGSMEEIREFCTGNYGTTFTQFNKVKVNGDAAEPLFQFLTAEQPFKGFGETPRGAMMHRMMLSQDKEYASKKDVKWNFTKFLVDRKGRVIHRFEPTEDISQVKVAVKEALKKK